MFSRTTDIIFTNNPTLAEIEAALPDLQDHASGERGGEVSEGVVVSIQHGKVWITWVKDGVAKAMARADSRNATSIWLAITPPSARRDP